MLVQKEVRRNERVDVFFLLSFNRFPLRRSTSEPIAVVDAWLSLSGPVPSHTKISSTSDCRVAWPAALRNAAESRGMECLYGWAGSPWQAQPVGLFLFSASPWRAWQLLRSQRVPSPKTATESLQRLTLMKRTQKDFTITTGRLRTDAIYRGP